MKKISTLIFVALIGSSAFAHNLWVKASNSNVVKAEMIYGHDFPNPEPIAQERQSLFEPVEIVGETNKIVLSQKGESYSYVGNILGKKGHISSKLPINKLHGLKQKMENGK